MKQFASFLAVLVTSTGFVFADTVATPPVGYTTITVAANSVSAISIPLDQIPDYQGVVSSCTATTITTTGAGWTATTQFGPFASNPHVVRMLSGASKGRHFQVTSNSNTTLTVSLPSGVSDLSTVVAAGDTYELVPVDTLGSFFGTGASSSVTKNSDPTKADNVLVRVNGGWLTFYNDGTNWLLQGGGASAQNNIPMMPESGVLFVRNAPTSLSLVVSGQVPITNLITDLSGSSTTFFANRFPMDNTLSGLGLQSLANWVSGSDPATADNVLIRVPSGWLTFYYDGTKWLLAGGGQSAINPTIAMGTSVLIVHRSSQPMSLNQSLPYSL